MRSGFGQANPGKERGPRGANVGVLRAQQGLGFKDIRTACQQVGRQRVMQEEGLVPVAAPVLGPIRGVQRSCLHTAAIVYKAGSDSADASTAGISIFVVMMFCITKWNEATP
jgi:hypothetical protein